MNGRHGRDWPDDEAARRLRDVLAHEARAIHPSPDALVRIQQQIREQRGHRWLRTFAVSAAALATAAVAIFAVIVMPSRNTHDNNRVPSAVSPSATVSSPSATQKPATDEHAATIYYVGKLADPQQRLYFETVNRPVPTDKAFVRDAIEALLTTRPNDPDYVSYWPTTTTIRGVTIHNGTQAVVDLSAAASTPAPGGEGKAAISIQQLLYTIHAAAPKIDSLELRVDGAPVTSLWGSAVTEPVSLADATSVFSPVWITEPANGATVAQAVTFGGEASVFEATVSWRILMNGDVLQRGSAMASKGAPERGVWQASVVLSPGTYTIEAYEVSAKDGSPMYVDTKVITVK